jgi:hypothetical protein
MKHAYYCVLDSVRYMVFLLRPHEYFLEVDPQCFPEACDIDTHPIPFRRRLLPPILMASEYISGYESSNPSSETWNPSSKPRCDNDDSPSRSFPDWRTSPELYRDLQNTRVPRPHHQRPVTSFHSLCI